MEIHNRRRSLPLSLLLLAVVFLLSSPSFAFDSDELLLNDDEFEGVNTPVPSPTPRNPDLDSSASSSSSSSTFAADSKAIQFNLDHSFAGSAFTSAGTFTARLKSWSHGGQTLTKLRFSRNAFTGDEKEAFERLLKDDEFYSIRVPSNVLNPAGKEYVVSSVRARCLPREKLDEHFVIHTEGVNILAVNYGSAGSCPYPRSLKLPTKWSFNSHTVLKNSEQARRTPTFAEEVLLAETVEGEGVKPPEKPFWAKYWMYLIPLGMVVMNAVTQGMNMPEEQAAVEPGAQPQPAIAQRTQGPAVRRR